MDPSLARLCGSCTWLMVRAGPVERDIPAMQKQLFIEYSGLRTG